MRPTSTPACYGANPDLFDDPERYHQALHYCATCPARAWCLQWIDPARNHYDGVAGGYAWREGNASANLNPHLNRAADPVLDTYLKARNK